MNREAIEVFRVELNNGDSGSRVKMAATKVAGEPISMSLPTVGMPRSNLHEISGHAAKKQACAGAMHVAQNDSFWEMAA